MTISHLYKCIKKSSFHVAMKLWSVCIMFSLKRTLNIFLPYKYCIIKFVYCDGALRVFLWSCFFCDILRTICHNCLQRWQHQISQGEKAARKKSAPEHLIKYLLVLAVVKYFARCNCLDQTIRLLDREYCGAHFTKTLRETMPDKYK